MSLWVSHLHRATAGRIPLRSPEEPEGEGIGGGSLASWTRSHSVQPEAVAAWGKKRGSQNEWTALVFQGIFAKIEGRENGGRRKSENAKTARTRRNAKTGE